DRSDTFSSIHCLKQKISQYKVLQYPTIVDCLEKPPEVFILTILYTTDSSYSFCIEFRSGSVSAIFGFFKNDECFVIPFNGCFSDFAERQVLFAGLSKWVGSENKAERGVGVGQCVPCSDTQGYKRVYIHTVHSVSKSTAYRVLTPPVLKELPVKHFEQSRVAKEIIDIQKANAAKQYSKNS
ncbi:hypothetical protein MAR_001041, partial [Mya arenaria]